MHAKYDPKKIEPKWQKEWETKKIYKQYDRAKKFYALDMFPYPSGAGLHVGHPKGYIATDVVARKKQLEGYSVLHPMGWDAFGLPAERFAIKSKTHPRISVRKNIANFKKQLSNLGFTYDWDREINTTDPEYYRWTQWIFLQLFKKGLVYESEEPINWCPTCQTGLANEDLEDGKCEVCGSEIEKKPLRQWVIRMTAYADRLLHDLDAEQLDWSESIKEQQRNWIGRSEGTLIKFPISNNQFPNNSQIQNSQDFIEVFTTRVDTIFGCTYVVVAPEHQLIFNDQFSISNSEEVRKYIESTKKKTEQERNDASREKTGVRLEGVEAVNPFTGESVPIYVADYVLGNYGTGAVMAVPAHDERDFAFAKKYDVSVRQSVGVNEESGIKNQAENMEAFVEDGILVNSGEFTGLSSQEAREKMTAWLMKRKLGKKQVNYKLRDWVFSRQRYWGEPIPLMKCESCGWVPVPEKELPLKLPEVKSYEPTGTGESPLASIEKWVKTKCPVCGGAARRENNTMPQWAGSSWYYLRYIDPNNSKKLINPKKEKEWMPVDLYVGGAEHATRHLLYARFWHKFLYDISVVSTKEPFKRLAHVGLIMASDGRKMSKRWGNVVNPDDMVRRFGADALRLYEMFLGPFSQSVSWNTDGVVGMRRFLEKVWRLAPAISDQQSVVSGRNPKAESGKLNALLHKTIKKVSEDIEGMRFNTAISALMIFVNEMEKAESVAREDFETLLILLSPFAPHIAEELWSLQGNKASIMLERWPKANSKFLKEEMAEVVIQVNGKLRARLRVLAGSSQEDVERMAQEEESVKKYLANAVVRKVIFVPDRLVNFVV